MRLWQPFLGSKFAPVADMRFLGPHNSSFLEWSGTWNVSERNKVELRYGSKKKGKEWIFWPLFLLNFPLFLCLACISIFGFSWLKNGFALESRDIYFLTLIATSKIRSISQHYKRRKNENPPQMTFVFRGFEPQP